MMDDLEKVFEVFAQCTGEALLGKCGMTFAYFPNQWPIFGGDL